LHSLIDRVRTLLRKSAAMVSRESYAQWRRWIAADRNVRAPWF
jgi:hypothetical protein